MAKLYLFILMPHQLIKLPEKVKNNHHLPGKSDEILDIGGWWNGTE